MIFKLNWTKMLVYSSALQCKEVQSSIEKFHWSRKLRKTGNFSFNLNILVFCVLKSFWQCYIKLMLHKVNHNFHLKIRNILELRTCPVKFGTTCPSVIFLHAEGSRPSCLRYSCCWLAHVFGKRTPFNII